jgi:nucleotide-binding universal stress UspA family protein
VSVSPTPFGNGSSMNPLVVVALDASTAGELALATGARLATKLEADVVAVHVSQNGSANRVREIALDANVPLFVRRGEIAAELGDAYLEFRACAIVASGGVAREVLARVPIAVAVAPTADLEIEIDLVAETDQSVSTRSRGPSARSG